MSMAIVGIDSLVISEMAGIYTKLDSARRWCVIPYPDNDFQGERRRMMLWTDDVRDVRGYVENEMTSRRRRR
jgi:hypothetical protein